MIEWPIMLGVVTLCSHSVTDNIIVPHDLVSRARIICIFSVGQRYAISTRFSSIFSGF